MQLRYYKHKLEDGTTYSNFGDELNAWLWPKLIPDLFDSGEDIDFLGIGSLLGYKRTNTNSNKTKIIFGTGAIATDAAHYDPIDENWRVYFFRGPLTAKSYNLTDCYVTDPGILVSFFKNEIEQSTDTYNLGFMPHITQSIKWDKVLKKACSSANILYIDPKSSIPDILKKIKSVSVLASEAMHGVIVADALRVPWIPVHTTYNLHVFKWKDWCASMDVPFNPQRILNLSYLFDRLGLCAPKLIQSISSYILTMHFRRLAASDIFYLSQHEIFNAKIASINSKIKKLNKDIASGITSRE